MADYYSYDPRKGHGLPHDPFNAIVGPRPIGWMSTRSARGINNLAPYSFFNAFNYVPPIIGFASIGYKDTVRNIAETGEFVWNLVTRELAEAMNQSCAPFAPDISEFDACAIAQAPSTLVGPPRVADARVAFECQCTDIIQLKDRAGAELKTWLVLGEVITVHIDRALLVDGVYDTAHAGHVLRAGGPADYFTVGSDQLFKVYRPQ